VHRILSDYNATIDVQSQPGRGTTFRVRFPPALRTTEIDTQAGEAVAARAVGTPIIDSPRHAVTAP
jgi:hypothetical protein